MAEAVVGGVHILRGLSQALDGEGYRVLLHDRRNCGASDVAFDDSGSEARGLGRRSA